MQNDYIAVQKEIISVLKQEGFFDNNSIVNEETGLLIKINVKGIKETLANGNRFQNLRKRTKELKVATIRQLPNIIKTGCLIEDNVENWHDANGYRYAYLYNNVYIDNEKINVRISIKKKVNSNLFWIHNIDEYKKDFELLKPSKETVIKETQNLLNIVSSDKGNVKVDKTIKEEKTNLYNKIRIVYTEHVKNSNEVFKWRKRMIIFHC